LLLLNLGGWIPEGFRLPKDLSDLLLLLDLGLHFPSAHQSCFYFLKLPLLSEWPLGLGLVDPFALAAFADSIRAETHLL
jgi:hypothetical protein